MSTTAHSLPVQPFHNSVRGGLVEAHRLRLAALESEYLLAKQTLQDRFDEDIDTAGPKTSTFAPVGDERTWASDYLNESDWLFDSRRMHNGQSYPNERLEADFVADVDMVYDILNGMRASGFLTQYEYEKFALVKSIVAALAKWIAQIRTQERGKGATDNVVYSAWGNGEGRALAQAVFYAEDGDRISPVDHAYNIWSTEEGWMAKNKAISNEKKGRMFLSTFADALAEKLRTENKHFGFPAWFWKGDPGEANHVGIHNHLKRCRLAR
jgi:hypothetical protein